MQKLSFNEYMNKFPKLEKEFDGTAMCAMKWIHQYVNLETGAVKMCHNVPHRYITEDDIKNYGKNIFMYHPYEQARRADKLNNVKHSECNSCWESESKGIRSCRLPQPFYDMHRSRFGGSGLMPTQLEIVFSSACDLKCIYCSSKFSTQWQIEDNKFNKNFLPNPIAPNGLESLFWKWLEEDAVENLLQYYIMGGEPLIQPKFYKFTEKLIYLLKTKPNRFNVKPALIIVTNGNTPSLYIDKWLAAIPKFDKFMSIQIDFSVEGVEKKAEYIRSNLNWEKFCNNVDILFKNYPYLRYRFSITHSVLSITSIKSLLQWIKQVKDKHGVQVDLIRTSVAYPHYLAPWMLTENFAQYIDEACNWIDNNAPEWKNYISHLQGIKSSFGKHDIEHLKKFLIFHQQMKERRNMDAEIIFPEMQEWINYCKEKVNV